MVVFMNNLNARRANEMTEIFKYALNLSKEGLAFVRQEKGPSLPWGVSYSHRFKKTKGFPQAKRIYKKNAIYLRLTRSLLKEKMRHG
jgi:hypothetical protein